MSSASKTVMWWTCDLCGLREVDGKRPPGWESYTLGVRSPNPQKGIVKAHDFDVCKSCFEKHTTTGIKSFFVMLLRGLYKVKSKKGEPRASART